MKILMLSWEYPPKNVGGLSNHIYYLSQALKEKGHEVCVITCKDGDSAWEEWDRGVHVIRVLPYGIETEDFVKWVMHLNFSMMEAAVKLINSKGSFDLVHCHDWLTVYAAKAVKDCFHIPMLCTIHATEYGRNNGIHTPMQKYIASAEWMMSYESWKIIACSHYMEQQILQVFKCPQDKLWVIPNGVDTKQFHIEFDRQLFRRNYAEDEEKIIFFIGRHVFEKGLQVLIDAAPEVIRHHSNAKFVIAGTGPLSEEMKNRAAYLGIGSKVLFTGYMDDPIKNMMYKVSDLAVFPSLYEPFGIVALEAMGAGCPLVVSDSGGMGEIVQHEYNGMKCISGSSESLAYNINRLLSEQDLSTFLSENGLKTVQERYNWKSVSRLTDELYETILQEAESTEWSRKTKEAGEK